MRFFTGLYLLIFGFVWVWQLAPNSTGAKIFLSHDIAMAFGMLSFAFGLFSVSPKLWAWKDAEEGTMMANINQLLRGSWYGIGGLMALMGLGMLACAILFLKQIGAPASFLFVMTGLVYGVGGASLVRAPMVHKGQDRLSGKRSEATNHVLRVARRHAGRVTATEIATETNLDVREAAKLLATLASEGFCEERVSGQGSSFYYFPEFASPDAKRDMFEDDHMSFNHEPRQDVVLGHESQAQQQQQQAVAQGRSSK